MDKARLQRRLAELEKQVGAQHTFAALIGTSAALQQAKNLAERVAPRIPGAGPWTSPRVY
jgi:two-component system NtrC family response regulator